MKILEYDINSVETQYNRCLKRYKTTIKDFLSCTLSKFEVEKSSNLGKEFADFRNKDAHGGFITFTNSSVCAFVVGLVLIECMILEDSNYSLAEIKGIIEDRHL